MVPGTVLAVPNPFYILHGFSLVDYNERSAFCYNGKLRNVCRNKSTYDVGSSGEIGLGLWSSTMWAHCRKTTPGYAVG
jgi:hypothetical protein